MSHYSNKSNKNCSFCKDQGHHVKQCLVLANNECGNCHQTGHTTRHCRNQRGNQRGNQRCNQRGNQRGNQPQKRIQKNEANVWNLVTNKKNRFTPSMVEPAIQTKKVHQISPTHVSYNRFNGVECELVIERTPLDGIPTYKDVVIKENASVVVDAPTPAKIMGSMFKRTIPRGVRWADVADEESDDE